MAPSAGLYGFVRRRFPAVVCGAVALPFLVALVATVSERWYPGSDNALEVLRIADVGGRDTPLTGVISRFGWEHPGPLLFYVLAPFHWLAGNRGILFGALVVNLASALVICWAARRRGGDPALVVFGVAVLLLVRGGGAGLLVDPWNPWIAVLPFFAFLVLAWCVAERDFAALPVAVLTGSFVVQAHVGYAPLVGGLGAVAIGLAFVRRPGEPEGFGPVRRWSGIAVGLAVLAWLPPLVDQVAGDGNLGDIVGWFRQPGEARLGFSGAIGLVGRELPVTWLVGHEVHTSGPLRGLVAPASAVPALLFFALVVAAAAVAWRRGGPDATRFAGLVAAATVFGVVATSRITGLIAPYLVRWWWVLAAGWWCALAWATWSALGRPFPDRARVLAAAGVGLAAAAVALGAVSARTPQPEISEAVGAMLGPTAAALASDEAIVVRCTGAGDLDATCLALFVALRERGVGAALPTDRAREVGEHRTVDPATAAAVLTVVTGTDRAARVVGPRGALRLADYELDSGLGFSVWRSAGSGRPGAAAGADGRSRRGPGSSG